MYIYPVHVNAELKPVKSGTISYRVVGNVHDTIVSVEGLSDKLNQEDMHGWNEMCSIVGRWEDEDA